MQKTKEKWKKQIQGIEKRKIKWQWKSNGKYPYDGIYQGQLKNSKPDGLGTWKGYGSNHTVEGEWEDGYLNGKVVENCFESREEYEAKDGKINGKYIQYCNDGSRKSSEWKNGQLHGRHRIYNKDGIITDQRRYENGK